MRKQIVIGNCHSELYADGVGLDGKKSGWRQVEEGFTRKNNNSSSPSNYLETWRGWVMVKTLGEGSASQKCRDCGREGRGY